VDVDDIGRACASILSSPVRHAGKAYDITGPAALSFDDVADTLTRVLGRRIAYRPAWTLLYVLDEVRRGRPAMMAVVMAVLYTVQRRGKAAPVCGDLMTLIGTDGGDLASYVERERAAFVPA